MLFATAYMHYAYNYNHNENVLRVFLFIYVFNNFVKFYGYCRVDCLEVPIFKVTYLKLKSQFIGLVTLLQFYQRVQIFILSIHADR